MSVTYSSLIRFLKNLARTQHPGDGHSVLLNLAPLTTRAKPWPKTNIKYITGLDIPSYS